MRFNLFPAAAGRSFMEGMKTAIKLEQAAALDAAVWRAAAARRARKNCGVDNGRTLAWAHDASRNRKRL